MNEITRSVNRWNEETYHSILSRIETLMDSQPGTPEERELEQLSILVEQYEKIHFPIDDPSPEALAEFRQDQEGKPA